MNLENEARALDPNSPMAMECKKISLIEQIENCINFYEKKLGQLKEAQHLLKSNPELEKHYEIIQLSQRY